MKQPSREYKTARILSYTIGGIITLLPFQAFLTTWVGSNTGHLDLIRIWKELLMTLIALPTAWLIFKSASLRQWFRRSFLAYLIYLYFILQLTLGIWALKHHQVNASALIYALIINLRFFSFFLLCLVVGSYDTWLKRYWQRLLLLPSVIFLSFGLAQRFLLPYDFLKHFGYGPSTIPAYQTVDANIHFRRIQSTLRGANPLGAYLVLIIPGLTYLHRSYWRWVGLAASLSVLYLTYSRSAWVGAFLALATLASFSFSFKRHLRKIMIVALALTMILGISLYALRNSAAVQDNLFHTSSSSKNISSNTQRGKAIENALQDVWHQPFGRGPGTAGPASARNSGHRARIAENYFLQIGQEVGILGIILFLMINLLIARALWRLRAEPLARILLASLLGISFVNLVSHAWADDTLSLVWWGLAGVCLAWSGQSNKSSGKKRSNIL